MDALLQLESIHAAQWQNLFIRNIELYLDGAKAPDTKFRDFRNHVLHVNDNYWGGAVVKAEEWYQRLCDCLREEDWSRAVYAAGVMTHYVTDPFMPLHTAQSEAEGAVHRAAEWSVTKSYDSLIESLVDELGGYQSMSLSQNDDWLALAIIAGAQQANQHYDTLIDHYDLEVGVKRPEDGLDQECRDLIARLLGSATITVSRILDRAFDVTGATPPQTSVTLAGYLTSVTTPVFWLTRRMANSKDKEAVRAVYDEVQLRNRAIESLPEDERTVRALHAEEVLGITEEELEKEEPRLAGTKFGTGTPSRQHVVEPDDDEEESDQVADTSESETAAESPQKAPTKFGQSAWRERRRKRREAANEKTQEAAQLAESEAETLAASATPVQQASADPEEPVEEDSVRTPGKVGGVLAAASSFATSLRRKRKSADDEIETPDPVAEQQAPPTPAEQPVTDPVAPTDDAEDASSRTAAKVGGVMAAASSLAASIRRRRKKADVDEVDQVEAPVVESGAAEQLDAFAEAAEKAQAQATAAVQRKMAPKQSADAYGSPPKAAVPTKTRRAAAAPTSRPLSPRRKQPRADNPAPEPPATEPTSTEEEHEPVVFERVEREARGPRFYLELDSPIVDAPSIGGGTAKRLRKSGIRTVGDLLECDVELIAEATRASYVTEESLTDWQNQSRLQCQVPGLRGHDAQILVACGLSDPSTLSQMTPDAILEIVEPFAASEDGEKILRSSNPPDHQEVSRWIQWAGQSRSLRAA